MEYIVIIVREHFNKLNALLPERAVMFQSHVDVACLIQNMLGWYDDNQTNSLHWTYRFIDRTTNINTVPLNFTAEINVELFI